MLRCLLHSGGALGGHRILRSSVKQSSVRGAATSRCGEGRQGEHARVLHCSSDEGRRTVLLVLRHVQTIQFEKVPVFTVEPNDSSIALELCFEV